MQSKEQPLGPDRRPNLAKLLNGPDKAGERSYLDILGQMARDPEVDEQKINELLEPVISLCDYYEKNKENKKAIESERILSRLKILQGSFSGNEQALAVELKRIAKAYNLSIFPDPSEIFAPSTSRRFIRQDPPHNAVLFLNGKLAVACALPSRLVLYIKMFGDKWSTLD